MNGKIAIRIVSALVLIAAIAGLGYVAFNAGVAQGSPVTVNAPEPAGQSYPAPYYHHGFGMPMPFFGFGCFGILFTLFRFGMAMKAFRMMAFGRHFGHMHAHGPWRHGWGEKGVPPMFEEWHKRAHGEAPAEDKKE